MRKRCSVNGSNIRKRSTFLQIIITKHTIFKKNAYICELYQRNTINLTLITNHFYEEVFILNARIGYFD